MADARGELVAEDDRECEVADARGYVVTRGCWRI